jgi:hypothetical protein
MSMADAMPQASGMVSRVTFDLMQLDTFIEDFLFL